MAALQEHPFERLVEVGPGGGALTKYLLQLPDIDFNAVELDDEKVAYLTHTYPAIQGKIIHQDFLQIAAPFEDGSSAVARRTFPPHCPGTVRSVPP